jgi:hypothetical protein
LNYAYLQLERFFSFIKISHAEVGDLIFFLSPETEKWENDQEKPKQFLILFRFCNIYQQE